MITIRKLEGADFGALCVLLDAYKRDIEEEPMDTQAKQRVREAIERGQITFYVACEGVAEGAAEGVAEGVAEGAKLVGMCSVCETFSTYLCRKSGVFEDFYIVPQFRRTGLARRLTGAVFEDMRRRGVATLWVGSSPSDVRMYESLGFDAALGELRSWNSGE